MKKLVSITLIALVIALSVPSFSAFANVNDGALTYVAGESDNTTENVPENQQSLTSEDASELSTMSTSKYLIDDQANLFTDYEKSQIENAILENLEGASLVSTIFVVTTDNNPYDDAQTFAAEYMEEHTENEFEDKIMYLIDMATRTMWIECDGAYCGIMDYDRIQRALDDAYEEISNGNYAGSAIAAIDYIARYNKLTENGCFELYVDGYYIDLYLINDLDVISWTSNDARRFPSAQRNSYILLYNPDTANYYRLSENNELIKIVGNEYDVFIPYMSDSSTYNPTLKPAVTKADFIYNMSIGGLIGLAVGFIISRIVKRSVINSAERERKAMSEYTLGERVSLNLTRSTDTLIDTKTTSRYIPPPSNDSGGSSSFGGGHTASSFHSSSGGHSFSGGGRSF